MKHIGLFEGIGGFSLAARWMGWETVAWCEWNEFGQRVLKHHFPNAIGHGDITKTDFTIYRGQCDIVTGGFPCQPYSQAGKRLGLVNWSGGLVFHEVQTDLEAAGYEVFPYVLPACAVNAPHRRDRAWFVAHSNKNSRLKGQSQEQILGKRNVHEQSSGGFEGFRGRRHISAPALCGVDDGISARLDGITFSSWRTKTLEAYGNAIVPQVAFQLFKAIDEYETHIRTF